MCLLGALHNFLVAVLIGVSSVSSVIAVLAHIWPQCIQKLLEWAGGTGQVWVLPTIKHMILCLQVEALGLKLFSKGPGLDILN